LLLKSDFYMATRMSIAYTPSGNTPFKHQVSDRKLIVNGVIFDSIDFATAPIRPRISRATVETAIRNLIHSLRLFEIALLIHLAAEKSIMTC
jgi:hypothetical protein